MSGTIIEAFQPISDEAAETLTGLVRCFAKFSTSSPVPEDIRGGLVIKAFGETETLSVVAVLIHLNDPADRQEGQRNPDPVLSVER